jgi:predicted amino acid dehydrogenase
MARKKKVAVPVVVDVSLAESERNYDTTVNFLEHDFRIVRVGADGDVDRGEEMVKEWMPAARVFAITGARDARTTGILAGDEKGALRRLESVTGEVPVTNGSRLRDVLQEWTIRKVAADKPGLFNNARTVVLGGSHHRRTARLLAEFTDNIKFADAVLQWGLPSMLDSFNALDRFSGVSKWFLNRVPDPIAGPVSAPGRRFNQSMLRKAVAEADVLVATYDELMMFDLEELAGKTLITSAISEERLDELHRRGVDLVLDDTPQPFEGVTVNAAVLEALMLAATGAEESRLTDDDLLDMITSAGLEPRSLYPGGYKRKSRFAFVIHPLSQQYFRKVEPLNTIAKVSPQVVMDGIEKAIAYAPPFTYSHVTGIKSPTGDEAEGWLITVSGTPKQLMAHDPEFTYSRLLHAADIAKKLGAQIMGLGAFTKVVGDAGVTVAKRAPLPITTGNSYSASGALWALHDAIRRLGIAQVDDEGRLLGKGMVVGATGAIGSVCARLLAMATDELWLVSPEPAKLLALKADIERDNPRAKVFVAATPDDALPDMDAIVTATSGAGKRVLDIMQVKPGCVITDVARPLDLSAEDVAKRPDVLVVESGEIQLPGDVHMGNIGLPPGVAYACLAETIVLALEGRYETFTIGRNIEWEKVKEIYKLGLKHGMKLATISGVNGVYTDEDLARVRELALAARAEAGA